MNNQNEENQKFIYIALQNDDVANICASEGLGSGESPLATYRIIGGSHPNHGTRTATCDFNPSLDVMIGFDKIPAIKTDHLQQEGWLLLPNTETPHSNLSPIVKADCFIRVRHNINLPIIKESGLNIYLIHGYILFDDPQEITFLFENEKQLESCKNKLQSFGMKNLARYIFKTIQENEQIAINEAEWSPIKDKIQKKIGGYKKTLSDKIYQKVSKHDMELGAIAGYEIGIYIKENFKQNVRIKRWNKTIEEISLSLQNCAKDLEKQSCINDDLKKGMCELKEMINTKTKTIIHPEGVEHRDIDLSRKIFDQKLKAEKKPQEIKQLLKLIKIIRDDKDKTLYGKWNWSDSDKQANMLGIYLKNSKFRETDNKYKMTLKVGRYLRNRNSNPPPTLNELNAYPLLQALFVALTSEGKPEKVIDAIKTDSDNAQWILGVFCTLTGYAAINKALTDPQKYIASDIPETTNNKPH